MAKFDDNPESEKFGSKMIFQTIAIAFVIVLYCYLFLVTVFDL